MGRRPLVAPSLLSANFGSAAEGVRAIEEAGGDWVHLDVMDGNFVPEITFGTKMVRDLRSLTSLPFDVHLMVDKPAAHVGGFVQAGANLVTVHAETETHLHRLLVQIRELGAQAGVSLVPSSPVSLLSEVLHCVDLVLVMTVNPGFGGQSLIQRTLEKVSQLRALRDQDGHGYLIQVDGGINQHTASAAVRAGADVLVTGSSFFAASSPGEYVDQLRRAASGAEPTG